MTLHARAIARFVLGPLLVSAFAAVELSRFGRFTAAAGAYSVFVVAQVAVDLWSRVQLRSARRRYKERRGR